MNFVEEEIRSFVISAFSGVTSGILYSLIHFIFLFINVKNNRKKSSKINYFYNKSVAQIIIDGIKNVIFFFISAVYFKWLCYVFNLPSFRLYMICGFLIGLYSYIKSFHKPFAIFLNVVYNKINQTLKKIITALNLKFKRVKGIIDERRKKTQSIVGCGIGRNNVTCYIGNNSCISTSRHIRKKKQNKRSRRGNSRVIRAN